MEGEARGQGGCSEETAREYVFLTLINAVGLGRKGSGAGGETGRDGLRVGRGWLRVGTRVRVFNFGLQWGVAEFCG